MAQHRFRPNLPLSKPSSKLCMQTKCVPPQCHLTSFSQSHRRRDAERCGEQRNFETREVVLLLSSTESRACPLIHPDVLSFLS
ncbi:unnamed protein product [Mesocestoides corti]|uniref:Uncharacterized protein n=1 Tax=Mesocestoides corti TaxID=53468 RepID=A0A0R3U7L7_MESCO|nr:unnamed protein product [Mesocestoides corti]